MLGLPGIAVTPTNTRLYPHGNEAAHILGTIDVDGKGIAGVEKYFNDQLSQGAPVALSIDVGVQAIVRAEIQKQITAFEAIGGAGLVLDIKTGELLALTSCLISTQTILPKPQMMPVLTVPPRACLRWALFFKVLNTAIALETGAASMDQHYQVL